MNRRDLLRALALAPIFAPKFGHWFRRGSGLIVPPPPTLVGAGTRGDPYALIEYSLDGDFSRPVKTIALPMSERPLCSGRWLASLTPVDAAEVSARYCRVRVQVRGEDTALIDVPGYPPSPSRLVMPWDGLDVTMTEAGAL